MKHYAIVTQQFQDDPYLEKNREGFTILFNTKEDAQEIIDKVVDDGSYSSVIELNLDM